MSRAIGFALWFLLYFLLWQPAEAQTVAKVDIQATFLRSIPGQPLLRVKCWTYDRYGRVLNRACTWTSRNTSVLTATSSVMVTTVTPRVSGNPYREVWLVASHSGRRDSVKIRVAKLVAIHVTPEKVTCDLTTNVCKAEP